MSPSVPILTIRDQKVILDSDLAVIYEVSTKRLLEQVRRNQDRFPSDFAFQIQQEEFNALRSQFATLKTGQGQHRKYLPFVFTEYGALQAANILRSDRAIQMSIFVIRAFVKMREELSTNATILKRLAEIDKTLLLHDKTLRDVYQKLIPFLTPPPNPAKPKIGFGN